MRFQVVLADLDTARVHLLRPPPPGSSHKLQSPSRHSLHPRLTPINSATNTAAAANASGGQSAAQQASAQAQRVSRFTAVPVSLPEGSVATATASAPTFDPTPCYDLDVQELGGPAPLVLALLERLADCYSVPDMVLPPELVRVLLL